LVAGDLTVPAGVDPADFIVWGKAPTRAGENGNGEVPSFADLVNLYLAHHRRLKADSTLSTEATHLAHLKYYLGQKATLSASQIQEIDLDSFLKKREEHSEAVTVIKHRQTVKFLFDWAVQKKYLPTSPATNLRRVQAGKHRDPFRTRAEIEEIISRGGLSDEEELAVWETLFLSQEESADILAIVEAKAAYDFIHPMISIAAYSGMRRGEIVRRLRWSDINFSRQFITARSRKQSRQQKETSREIPLHPDLEKTLKAYQAKRPKGQFVVCYADTLEPLPVERAHRHFQRTLRDSRWECILPSGRKKAIIAFHIFRHSFASNLAMHGVDARIIDQMMGHQTEEMRRRYQHLFPSKLSEAIRTLSFGPG
jgi:integrase